MAALAEAPPTNSGEIDAKMILINYRFLASSEDAYDRDGLARMLGNFQADDGFHVTLTSYDVMTYNTLFLESDEVQLQAHELATVVECRLVKQMHLDEPPTPLLDRVARGFESLGGVDGKMRFSERREGTAEYIRLLKGVPQSLRVRGL